MVVGDVRVLSHVSFAEDQIEEVEVVAEDVDLMFSSVSADSDREGDSFPTWLRLTSSRTLTFGHCLE